MWASPHVVGKPLLRTRMYNTGSMQKHAILVVGTGRSGTSAMTGTLQILGAHLGDSLTPGDAHNIKGYFENTDLVELNKSLLLAEGVLWYVTPIDCVHALRSTPEVCQAIDVCIQTIFNDHSLIAIKDPRLCALLEPYVSVLTALKYEIHCVLMSREPVEVAQSMESATDVAAVEYLPMVQHHTELLETALQRTAIDCIHVTFSELLTNTSCVVERLVKRLPFLSCADEQLDKIISFVDKSLRHHDTPELG